MPCPLCKDDPQPRNFGNPRGCAFESGVFSPDNWNCVTMNRLRSAVTWNHRDDLENCSVGVLPLPADTEAGYLVMTWYKERGATGNAFIAYDDEPIRPLTLELAFQILAGLRVSPKTAAE